MAAGVYLKRRFLNSFLGGASPLTPNLGVITAVPTHLAAAIDTAVPDDTGANFNEPASGNGYARLPLNLPSDFTNATNADPSLIENASALTFATATNAGWGTVTHVGFFDTATIGAGNLLYLLPLSTPRTIGADQTLSFSAGELELTAD